MGVCESEAKIVLGVEVNMKKNKNAGEEKERVKKQANENKPTQ